MFRVVVLVAETVNFSDLKGFTCTCMYEFFTEGHPRRLGVPLTCKRFDKNKWSRNNLRLGRFVLIVQGILVTRYKILSKLNFQLGRTCRKIEEMANVLPSFASICIVNEQLF